MATPRRIERIEPAAGQESVWDYPRPPRVERTSRRARVEFGGEVIADSRRTLRVLETAGAPCYYLPPEDVRMDLLQLRNAPTTICEWKGAASSFDITAGGRTAHAAAWTYLEPNRRYAELAGLVAFYPGRVDRCSLDDETVRPQPGRYYGGWITDTIVGPFKGEPGTEHR
jgi:uncharacterized protein (DUF427 family)